MWAIANSLEMCGVTCHQEHKASCYGSLVDYYYYYTNTASHKSRHSNSSDELRALSQCAWIFYAKNPHWTFWQVWMWVGWGAICVDQRHSICAMWLNKHVVCKIWLCGWNIGCLKNKQKSRNGYLYLKTITISIKNTDQTYKDCIHLATIVFVSPRNFYMPSKPPDFPNIPANHRMVAH